MDKFLSFEPTTLYTLKAIGDAKGDNRYLKQLLSLFFKQSEHSFQQVRTALRLGDKSSIRSVAHKLKGSAQCLGAHSLSRLSESLQREAEASDSSLGTLQHLLSELESSYETTREELAEFLKQTSS